MGACDVSGWAWAGAGRDRAVLVAPRLADNLEAVAVLGEAVDPGDDAGRAGEPRAPRLEGEIGRDDGGALLVAAADGFSAWLPTRIVATGLGEQRARPPW